MLYPGSRQRFFEGAADFFADVADVAVSEFRSVAGLYRFYGKRKIGYQPVQKINRVLRYMLL